VNFPLLNRLELPILQELAATGGSEDVRFLYDRLVSYFPQLDKKELNNGKLEKWRLHVQRAGRELDEQGFIRRERGIWTLTKTGFALVEAENTDFEAETANFQTVNQAELSHGEVQTMLCEIGVILGFHTQKEFEFYDVVWRTNAKSPRLSHVFEVQHKGNIDSAFAKLKKAHEAQRSKPFLILASERDTNRALRSISFEQSGAFHELSESLQILSFAQIEQLHRSLKSIAEILPFFLTT
jgi:hypothetical protein